jgi:PAS domain S-box-containing protein
MGTHQPTQEELFQKIQTLEDRLWEAEQTIQAIQSGEVDALVISKPDGERLYTLRGADHGYRILVESITEGALILSSDNSIYYCNRTLGKTLGLPAKKLIGKRLDSYVAAGERSRFTELLMESRKLGAAKGEFVLERSGGACLPVNVSLSCLNMEDFQGVCAVVTDLSGQKGIEAELRRHRSELKSLIDERTADLRQEITERKRIEDELRVSRDELELRVRERTAQLQVVNQELRTEIEERKRAEAALQAERQRLLDVLETLPIMVCLLTPDYHVAFANRSFRDRFGESRGRHCYEYCFGRTEPCPFCESYNVLKTGLPHRWEVADPMGGIIDAYDFPFTDIDGSPLILEMDIDITERRQTEGRLRAYAERLESLNKELQDFTFIASHDLQEPLRKIQAFGNLLIQKHGKSLDTVGQDYLDRMTKAAKRMSELLRRLLDYSRTGTHHLNFQPVSLSEVAEDAVNDLELLFHKSKGKVEIGELPTIDADAVLLRQLFLNIIGNSIKYRRDSEPFVVKVCGEVSDGLCRITIEDNGIGFDESYHDKIFKPFERLHGRGSGYSGSGMGLAICKKIIDRHGGTISARSTPGTGSTFILTLPTKRK